MDVRRIIYQSLFEKSFPHSASPHFAGDFTRISVAVASPLRRPNRRAKFPTNCDAHLAEILFQTRSRTLGTGIPGTGPSWTGIRHEHFRRR
ncbi:MAG: DUF6783 domain-containing protein [Ruminococcus sp.]